MTLINPDVRNPQRVSQVWTTCYGFVLYLCMPANAQTRLAAVFGNVVILEAPCVGAIMAPPAPKAPMWLAMTVQRRMIAAHASSTVIVASSAAAISSVIWPFHSDMDNRIRNVTCPIFWYVVAHILDKPVETASWCNIVSNLSRIMHAKRTSLCVNGHTRICSMTNFLLS